MAEHDYVIANQNGANTRSDLNNALAAIVSNNSKATEPTTTYAYMWWADTGNDLLKQRNGADSAWISILTLSTGTPSVATGASELGDLSDANTTATSNLGLGTGAVDSITTGDYNVGVGDSALTACTEGIRNTANGAYALFSNTTGSYNTASGMHALYSNTTGYSNTANGMQALYSNTTGNYNTAVGLQSLYSNTSGDYNVAIGKEVLRNNTTGANNTGTGYRALYSNTTGPQNTAVGYLSLTSNTSGGYCTAFGAEALKVSTSSHNTALGRWSLYSQTTGAQNCGTGNQTLQVLTTGIFNAAFGNAAGDTTTTGSYNTFLGAGATGSAAAANYNNVIGYNVVGAGAYNTTVGIAGNKSWLAQGATSWSGTSDSRLKDNIITSTAGLSFINELRPVTFEWKAKGDVPIDLDQYKENSTERVNGNDKVNHGFIAQEVKAAIDAHPEIASGHGMWTELSDGTQGVAQGNLVPMLVKAIQELSAKVEALENA